MSEACYNVSRKAKVNFNQISLCSGNWCCVLLNSIGQSPEDVEIENGLSLQESNTNCVSRKQ